MEYGVARLPGLLDIVDMNSDILPLAKSINNPKINFDVLSSPMLLHHGSPPTNQNAVRTPGAYTCAPCSIVYITQYSNYWFVNGLYFYIEGVHPAFKMVISFFNKREL